MRNPFAKPETLMQWMLSSMCWIITCVGVWVAIYCIVVELPPHLVVMEAPAIFISFIIAHGLVWRKAIVDGWALTSEAKVGYSAIDKIAAIWLKILILSQVIWLSLVLTLFVIFTQN